MKQGLGVDGAAVEESVAVTSKPMSSPISMFMCLIFLAGSKVSLSFRFRRASMQLSRTLAESMIKGRGLGGRLLLVNLRRETFDGAGSPEPRASGSGAKPSINESIVRLVPFCSTPSSFCLVAVVKVLVALASLWL